MFSRRDCSEKCMPIISIIDGLFCSDKFEETPYGKLVNMTKLTKSFFNRLLLLGDLGKPAPNPIVD